MRLQVLYNGINYGKSKDVHYQEMVIPSVDDLLYEIGLCLTSVRERPKRRRINNPIVITIISIIFMTAKLVNSYLDDNQTDIGVLLCDIGRYFGMTHHWNLGCFCTGLIVVTSQMNYYYNYKRGIKPTFVRVFQMMSGLVTPNSVVVFKTYCF